MPFIEAAEIERDTVVEADACIVGAGPAGRAFTHSFRRTPLRVCVLESGGFSEESELQALNIGENFGIDDVPLETARYRLFGGTTHRWTGWCRPLDEVDFERRPWVRHSGWPIALHGGFHHLGTTRMSENARDGVVDRNCRVDGMANLYVADSSVFPTGGYANPTLTIVAIAMRAADHIRETLHSGAPIEKPRLAASLPDAANALDGSRQETAPLSTPRAGDGQP